MKKVTVCVGLLAISIGQASHAQSSFARQIRLIRQLLNQDTPGLSVGVGHSSYRYRSTVGSQYNRYTGDASSVTLGELNHKLNPNVELAGFVYGAKVSSSGQSLLTGGNPNGFSQSTNTLGINGSITFKLHTQQPIFISAFATVATNHTRTKSILNAGLVNEASGRTTYTSNNASGGLSINSRWFMGKWQWIGAANYSYSGNFQESYRMAISGVNINNQSLTMTQHNFSETLQLRYKLKPHVSPFALLTLTQGLDRRYSRNVSASALSNSFNAPKFQTALNGVQVGGGLAIRHKQVNITPSYRYQMQGKEFRSHNLNLQLAMMLN